MKVIAKIQNRATDANGRPINPVVDMTYYTGDNMVQVIHAITSIFATTEDDRFVELKGITIDMEA